VWIGTNSRNRLRDRVSVALVRSRPEKASDTNVKCWKENVPEVLCRALFRCPLHSSTQKDTKKVAKEQVHIQEAPQTGVIGELDH
jgi:hypothetical protein